MKTLTILRHAKSGWDDPVLRDFDRPLNAKGQRAARLMGHHLASLGLRFDLVVASSAVRVRETIDDFARGYGDLAEPEWDKTLYLASADTLLDHIHALPDSADRVLMIGHNPGLEDLVLLLTPNDGGHARDAVEVKFPTASVAEIDFAVERWADAKAAGGVLVRFIRPRDLDVTLGPDGD
ncbi:SixA phosphatase family protein [Sphingomonas sp. AX6]|uniref:SixA phosphatase family protein n=1 Tax=Sphingomonas sp. AX6 TaxID=2653171 RepID=UPI0012F1A28E|nr:histidine phosphatase family protein [Sphingomonas sp. AX6]VXC55723.1 Phosphohistidine phosphatase SixA [Sphingomonas sp. AX6]